MGRGGEGWGGKGMVEEGTGRNSKKSENKLEKSHKVKECVLCGLCTVQCT